MFRKLWSRWLKKNNDARVTSTTRGQRSAGRKIALEQLEERVVPSSTTVAASPPTIVYGTDSTFIATVTLTTGSFATGDVVNFYNAATSTLLGTVTGSHFVATGSPGVDTATLTTSSPLAIGAYSISATYVPATGTSVPSTTPATETVNYTPGDLLVTTVGTNATVGGTIASITESSTTATVTTTSPTGLVNGQTVTLSGVTPAGYNSVGTSTYSITDSATITAASNSGTTVTITANNSFVAGESVTISGVTPAGYDGTYTITSATSSKFTYTDSNTLGTATVSSATALTPNAFQITAATGLGTAGAGGTVSLGLNGNATTTTIEDFTGSTQNTANTVALTSGSSNLAEIGTTTHAGYLSDSLNGQLVSLAGYNATANASTSGANVVIGTVSPDGAVNLSTQISSAVQGSGPDYLAAISADGEGFYVTTGTGIRYVSFGGTTPSVISAASWTGGVATLTAPNSYVPGQTVYVSGITGATGYNGTYVVTGATSTTFSYALTTQPTGTAAFAAATSQLLPTLITTEANNPNSSTTQVPTSVEIGTSPNGSANQLFGTAGNQYFSGLASVDGPFTIGTGLPQSAGQSIGILGNGTGTNFPTAEDSNGNYPTTNQIVISPDGQTIFVADSRTDGLGGILEYYQIVPGRWALLGKLQLDTFTVTGASESGTTVTVTTSGATDFSIGEGVTVAGLTNTAYDGNFTVTGVSGSTFTYTASFTGLLPTTPLITGATATSANGGLYALTATFSGSSATLYATTSSVSGNSLVEITGGTTDGSTPSFAVTTLATAPANEAFRGVAFAPTAPAGTTATTTTLAVSPATSNYLSGVTLTATVSASAATGYVSFQTTINGVTTEIGTAPVSGGVASLTTSADLAPGSYNIFAFYEGDSTYLASTSSSQPATITKTATTTTLSFSPTTVGTNQADTLTAVIAAGGVAAPTGTVTFTNTISGTTLGTGTVSQLIVEVGNTPTIEYVATFTAAAGTFTTGTYSISAVYSGDGYYSTSTGTGSLQVVTSTTTIVTSSDADAQASTGEVLTVTATVAPASGTTAPGGTVTFYDDTLALGSATLSNGVATLNVGTSLVQSVTVQSATATTSGSTTTATLTTNANNPYTVGQYVTIEGIGTTAYDGSFQVTAVNGDTFSYVDPQAQGAGTDSAGGLAVGLDVLTPGLHSLTAVYTPTGSSVTSFASSSGVLEQTVTGQAFGPSDVFQERNGDGITNLFATPPVTVSGSVGATVYVDELTPTGTLVQSFALPTADSQAFSISSASESAGTVSITTASPSNLAAGQLVTISGLTPTAYNGTFTISTVNGNTFTYTVPTDLGSPTFTSATVQGVVHAVVGDGQQSTTGQMTLSANSADLFITGYDNNPLNPTSATLGLPTASGSQAVPRSIAEINAATGSVTTEAFYTNGSLNLNGSSTKVIFDGVYSADGTSFYLSGYDGVYYFPQVTQSATLQGSDAADHITTSSTPTIVSLESYDGNLYAIGGGSGSATSTDVYQVGTGMPTSLTTLTQLPGIPVNSSVEPNPIFYPTDAYFTHTNPNDVGLDTIYISDNGKTYGTGTITKWSLTTDPITSITESGTKATVTLSAATLGLVTGESVNITISGSSVTGYNGTFSATVVSATSFTFIAASGLGSAAVAGTASAFVEAPNEISYAESLPQLGFYFLAGTTNASTDVVTLYTTYGNGGNADTGPGITYSIIDANGFGNSPGIPITSATWSGGVVTITTSTATNYVLGQLVNISGITPAGYDGLFTITGVTGTTFTYAVAASLGSATVTGASALSVTTIDSVAYEDTTSSFLGNETDRGIAVGQIQNPSAVLYVGGTYNTPTTVAPGSTITVPVEFANTGAAPVTLSLLSEIVTYNPSVLTLSSYSQGAGLDSTFTTLGVAPDGYQINTLTASGNTVSVNTVSPTDYTTGETVTISDSLYSGYDGTYTITVVDPSDFTYTDANANGLAQDASQDAFVDPLPHGQLNITQVFGDTGVLTTVNPGSSIDVLDLHFTVNAGATLGSSTEVNLLANDPNQVASPTGVQDINFNPIILSPAPNTGNDTLSSVLNIKATTTISTSPTPATVVIGGSIADTATVSGGSSPTGTVTFTLYNNAAGTGTPLFSSTNSLTSGSATSGSYTPTTPGTDYWFATYSGDTYNAPATGASEQVTVSLASPTITSTASATGLVSGALGTTAPTLSDSAVLANGYNETGNLVFTLKLGATTVYTVNDPLSGNGTYTASTTLLTTGTVAGTYTWTVTYAGDSNNNSAHDQGGSTEQTVVNAATPTITSTASPAALTLTSTAQTLSDSAVVAAGYYETGNLVFTLSGPSGFSFTHTDTLSGNGTYTASDSLPSTAATGTYTWSVTYVGDGNNTSAHDQGGTSEKTVVNPALSISPTTLPNATSGTAYTQTLTVSGGTTPYPSATFFISAFNGGSTGLTSSFITANASAGTFTLSGTPSSGGTVTFTANVTDSVGATLTENYTLTVTSSTISTTTTLTDNGPNPSYTGVEPTVTVTVTPASGSAISGETVSIYDSTTGTTVGSGPLTSGTATFALTGTLASGANSLYAVYGGDATHGGSNSSTSPVTQTVTSTFQVNSWTENGDGVFITFDAPVAESSVVLYSQSGGATPDFTFTDNTTSSVVKGSLVVDPTNPYQLQFIPTAGALTSGSYTLAMTTGVQSTTGVSLGAYSNTQTVTASSAPSLSIPSFARGPGQSVNVPASATTGIPITISGASTVTSVTFTLTYDPSILTIAGTGAITLSSGASSAGLTAHYTPASTDAHHASLTVTVSGGTWSAGTSATPLLYLTASVPNAAVYLNKGALNLINVSINGSTGQGVSGVDEDAYVGDVTGAESYTALDAATDSQVSNAVGTGFNKFQALDPSIIGDTSGQGSDAIVALDAAQISQAGNAATVSTIPSIPGSASPTSGGADPILYIQAASAGAGLSTTVHVMLDVTDPSGITLAAIDYAIQYAAGFYTPSNVVSGGGSASISSASESGTTVTVTTAAAVTDLAVGSSVFISGVSVGGSTSNGYNGTFTVTSVSGNTFTYTAASGLGTATVTGATAGTGLVGLGGFSSSGSVYSSAGLIFANSYYSGSGSYPTLPTGAILDVLDFTATVAAGESAGATTPLKLLASGTYNGSTKTTAVYNASQALVLNPAPSNTSFVTGVDNTLTVVGESGTLAFVNTSGSSGSTVTVHLDFTNGPVPFSLAALQESISYNANELSLTSANVVGGSGLASLGMYATSGSVYVTGANGLLFVNQYYSGTERNYPTINAGQVIDALDLTFTVSATATGTTYVNLDQSESYNGTTKTTEVFDPNVAITLTPAPTNPTTFGVSDDVNDGAVTIVQVPNQPPFDSLPSSTQINQAIGTAAGISGAAVGVLYNPANRVGLQTATPNTVTFSNALGDPIVVTDSDYNAGGPAETTTVSVTGTGVFGSTGPVGTLTATASGSASVSGAGTSTLTITGSPTDITNTLGNLAYTPGAGFFGTTTLTVSTNDNGNSGFGGSQIDTRSTTITVVGLFISEIDLDKGNTTNPSQYIELFSTVPSYTIPSTVYLVGVNGNTTGTIAPGLVTDIFNLGGLTTGTDDFLALLEKNEKYGSYNFEVTGGNANDNVGSGPGFGNNGTSKFDGITAVHLGGSRPSNQLVTDILNQAESFLLIQSSAANAPTTGSGGTNIDPGETGNPATQSSSYNSWNVLDSVAIGDASMASYSYAAITFEPTGANDFTLSGSNVVNTGTWVANYVGRIAENTGSSNLDWLASVVTGTPSSGAFTLGTSNSTAFAGSPLNNIGGPNDWAPQQTVVVNDGTTSQHSQVLELTVTYNEAVNIVNLASDFKVVNASGTPLSITVTDPLDGNTGTEADSDVTVLVITFNSGSIDTFNAGSAYVSASTGQFMDQYGDEPTVGLVDGNYYLDTKAADISSMVNSTVLLDGAHNGVSGSVTPGSSAPSGGQGLYEVDEFWRLFGDVNGTRTVDALDAFTFSKSDGTTITASRYKIASGSQQSGSKLVTLTLSTSVYGPFDFAVGEQVVISGLSVSGYNGTFVITGVTGSTISYNAATTGLASVTGGSTSYATNQTSNYLWYLDSNLDGGIDFNGNSADATAFYNNYYSRNGGHNKLAQ